MSMPMLRLSIQDFAGNQAIKRWVEGKPHALVAGPEMMRALQPLLHPTGVWNLQAMSRLKPDDVKSMLTIQLPQFDPARDFSPVVDPSVSPSGNEHNAFVVEGDPFGVTIVHPASETRIRVVEEEHRHKPEYWTYETQKYPKETPSIAYELIAPEEEKPGEVLIATGPGAFVEVEEPSPSRYAKDWQLPNWQPRLGGTFIVTIVEMPDNALVPLPHEEIDVQLLLRAGGKMHYPDKHIWRGAISYQDYVMTMGLLIAQFLFALVPFAAELAEAAALASEAATLAPEAGTLVPEVASLAPRVGAVAPETGVIAPEAGVVAREAGALAPEVQEVGALGEMAPGADPAAAVPSQDVGLPRVDAEAGAAGEATPEASAGEHPALTEQSASNPKRLNWFQRKAQESLFRAMTGASDVLPDVPAGADAAAAMTERAPMADFSFAEIDPETAPDFLMDSSEVADTPEFPSTEAADSAPDQATSDPWNRPSIPSPVQPSTQNLAPISSSPAAPLQSISGTRTPTSIPYKSRKSTPRWWAWTVAVSQAIRGEGLVTRLDERVDMPRGGSSTNARGWLRDQSFFFRQLLSTHPEFFSPSNVALIQLGTAPVVDLQWVAHHPEHAWCLGETLHHHHLGGGQSAVALPESVHNKMGWSKYWHQ